MEASNEAIEARGEALTSMFQMGTDALTGIIDGSMKAEDALKKLVLQLALAAAQSALLGSGPLAGLFGGFFPTAGGFASMLGMADGGRVRGPGGPRSDSVPAMLSNGEFVVNAAATRRNAGLLEAINSGSIPRFATGGLVGPSVPRIDLPSPSRGGGSGGQQNIHVTVGWSRSADGNLKPFVESVSRGQAQQVTANGLRAYDRGKQRQHMTGG